MSLKQICILYLESLFQSTQHAEHSDFWQGKIPFKVKSLYI